MRAVETAGWWTSIASAIWRWLQVTRLLRQLVLRWDLLEVAGGGLESVGVIAEVPEPDVAGPACNAPHRTGHVVMIYDGLGVSARTQGVRPYA